MLSIDSDLIGTWSDPGYWHITCINKIENIGGRFSYRKDFMSHYPRFGLHYFPDTSHYRQADLESWLPELVGMGVTWLTLQAPLERAIPEAFVSGLVTSGIQPLIHLDLPLGKQVDLDTMRLLLRSYASWGARYIMLFDRPNLWSAWPSTAWLQTELVERFLDYYLPVADLVQAYDLIPVFPPLLPGGDYWDLAFLGTTLRSLKRRQPEGWLDKFALAAYAGSGDRPLNWGSGGVQRWPGVRPYGSQPGMQDQRGFHIYDWYLPLCQEILGRNLPIFLLGLGTYPGDAPGYPEDCSITDIDENLQSQSVLDILALLSGHSEAPTNEPVPEPVQAGCFWLLAADPHSSFANQGWYISNQNGWQPRPVVQMLRQSIAGGQVGITQANATPKSIPSPLMDGSDPFLNSDRDPNRGADSKRPILHYILLPLYAWGAGQWDLMRIAPLLQDAHPTIGFSIEEASLAARVTILNHSAFSSQTVDFLRQAGCMVEILDDVVGTHIATTEEQ